MSKFSVIAARDGDVYHDEVEAADQAEAKTKARDQLASAWHMLDELQQARDEGDESAFDAELDGFAVDPLPPPVAELPAIKALIGYAADAPAIVCEEGYWDDGSESACADGMNQARSEAAELIRAALAALGIEPPTGVKVCPECFRDESDGHSHQCQTGQREDEAEEEAADELTAL